MATTPIRVGGRGTRWCVAVGYGFPWTKSPTHGLTGCVVCCVAELGYKRYKLITQVTIGEMKGQTMRIGSRCLWDVQNDNCASEVLQNNQYFCCAMVFGLYYE